MADCYVFKSILQEYAQKVGFTTPVYQTDKDGPSHEPVFKSVVIVNDVKYESLPGFLSRKAAEQSAAEVALMELQKSGESTVSIPTAHETGLCKNLLQEYAQKMNYAVPSYTCTKSQSGTNQYTCTVDIGGIRYIGTVAKTKKEAEIKAARTAYLAIQRDLERATNGASQYTVLPGKRKDKQTPIAKELKPKRNKFKKWKWSNKFRKNKADSDAKSNPDVPPNGHIVNEAAHVAQANDVEMSGKKENEPHNHVSDMKSNPSDAPNQLTETIYNGFSHDQGHNCPMAPSDEKSDRFCETKVADIASMKQEVVKVIESGNTQ